MIIYEIVEGTTGPQAFQLMIGSAPADLSGKTVALILTSRAGVVVGTVGNVWITDPKKGVVRYEPDPTDILAAQSPYRAHWAVTDGAGKVIFFPRGAADRWNVFAP